MVNLKGVETSVWIRLIVMAVIFANQVSVTIFDFVILPFTPEEVYEGISMLFTFAGIVWVTWKNNSLRKEAQIVDANLEAIKEGKVSVNQLPIRKTKKELDL